MCAGGKKYFFLQQWKLCFHIVRGEYIPTSAFTFTKKTAGMDEPGDEEQNKKKKMCVCALVYNFMEKHDLYIFVAAAPLLTVRENI